MTHEVVLMARFFAKPGREERVKEKLISLVEPTRKEPGCRLYNLHEEECKRGSFIFYEIWESKPALDTHLKGDNIKNVMKEIEDDLEKEPKIMFLTPLG